MHQKVNARDTRFILEVRPTTKVAYISVEVLTKSRVSFNPNPPKLPPRSTRFSLSIPMKRRAIQTSRDFTTILGSSQATPSRLGDWIPKINKHNEVIKGEGEVLLLEGGTLKEARIFSQESRLRIDVLEREEGAQALDLKVDFCFSEWPTAEGACWGLFIAPTSQELLEESFTGQVRWGHWTGPVDLSRSR
jgi:hypothetical protein